MRTAPLVVAVAGLFSTADAQEVFGTGCLDSAGNVPAIGFPGGSWIQNPSVDEHISLSGAIPGLSSVLLIGIEPAGRINLDLTPFGVPTCFAYVNALASIPSSVAPDGTDDISLGHIPTGLRVVGQWAMLDPTVGRPIPVTATAGLSAAVPTAGSPAYRLSSLTLRDPHIFTSSPFGCLDSTDLALNNQLNASITTDLNADGLLDTSFLFVFRPDDPNGPGGIIDVISADCPAPIDTTSCSASTAVRFGQATFVNSPPSCLAPVAGTTGGYSPPITTPTAPCFTSTGVSVEFDLGGIVLPLDSVQVGARYSAPDDLVEGLVMGFLPEATADGILLPAGLPLVGGLAISALLPGGTGNCSTRDDRDTLPDGTRGWWFYFNFAAKRVPITP